MTTTSSLQPRQRKQRPSGWSAPGPKPRGDRGRADLTPADDEDLAYLTGDFRVFQKKRGHRWSLDDFTTALFAIREARADGNVARAADLGCGIGSVLMMVAWALPTTACVGIEAQDVSLVLARRSLDYNGIDDRVSLVHGDLREESKKLPPRSFDLVTGTPPYIPVGSGLVSPRMQREPCFFETLGGLEDYCVAAARLLSERGRFVVCAGVHPADRGQRAAEAAGLAVERKIDVVPREGKPVLFRVFVMRHRAVAAPLRSEAFVVRDAAERITDAMLGARAELGIPEMEKPASS